MKANLDSVDLGPAPIERYRGLLGEEAWARFERTMAGFAGRMQGRVLWNVNSTPRGGGVAELLGALIPYDRGAGIDERWLVIEGSREFFEATKKIHRLLHGGAGDGAPITSADRRVYEQAMERNAAALLALMKPGDVAVLHDPQTAGLVPRLAERGVAVVWRSHIGVDEPNDLVRGAWKFLTPYLGAARAFVFSRQAYAWDLPEGSRVEIIAPCIDPFTTKNQDLDAGAVTEILRACRFVREEDGKATFMRHDGTAGRVRRPVDVTSRVPENARIVLQVSRWDRLKDPCGVLEAFARHVAPRTDAWLVLAGPAVDSVNDDPEQPEILRELRERRGLLQPDIRERTVIALLPMQDIDENAAIVNALQRRADLVVQKSLAEGFGLTVAEAMWKSRPVVASGVGGIPDQVEDGRSGILVDDPRDLESFGAAVSRVLQQPDLASDLGREARVRIIGEFLAPRHLMQQAELVSSLL